MLNNRKMTVLMVGFCLSVLYVSALFIIGENKVGAKPDAFSPEIEKNFYEAANKIAYPSITKTTEEEREKIITEVFTLTNPDVNRFLTKLMNMQPRRGMKSIKAWRREDILCAKGPEGFLWLLNNYDELSPVGRQSFVRCVRAFKGSVNNQDINKVISLYPEFNRYIDEIIIICLSDTTLVPIKRKTAPLPSKFLDDRICDIAYDGFYLFEQFLAEKSGKYATLKSSYGYSYEDRDKAIALLIEAYNSLEYEEFLKIQKEEFEKELKEAKNIKEDKKTEAEKAKIKAEFLAKLKPEIEKLRRKVKNGQKPKEPQKYPEEDERDDTPKVEHEK